MPRNSSRTNHNKIFFLHVRPSCALDTGISSQILSHSFHRSEDTVRCDSSCDERGVIAEQKISHKTCRQIYQSPKKERLRIYSFTRTFIHLLLKSMRLCKEKSVIHVFVSKMSPLAMTDMIIHTHRNSWIPHTSKCCNADAESRM